MGIATTFLRAQGGRNMKLFIHLHLLQYLGSRRVFPERPLIHLLVPGRRGNHRYPIGFTVRAQCEMTG